VPAAALVGAVVAELELELELLLQPAAASSAAATAAKPILLSLRTVVPPGVGSFRSGDQPGASSSAGCADRELGSARRRSFSSGWPRLGTASTSAYDGGSGGRIRLPSGAAGIRSMACSDGIEKPG
jgi:hypothetical protein